MNMRTLHLGMATLLLAGVGACGGSNQNTPPQNPGTTTTTSTPAPMPNGTNPSTPATSTTPYQEGSGMGQPYPNGTTTEGAQGQSSQYQSAPSSQGQNGQVNPNGQQQYGQGQTGQNGQYGQTSVTSGQYGAQSGGQGAGTDVGNVNDSQIAAIMNAVNTAEIEQARVAVKKAKDPKVKQFAEHMLAQHGQAETNLKGVDGKAGITPQASPVSDQLSDNNEHLLASLRSRTGGDFDRTYIDAQVTQHQQVLDDIDRIMPQVQNADLKTELTRFRSMVSTHLRDARDLQASLTK